jgi:hypothetical protein
MLKSGSYCALRLISARRFAAGEIPASGALRADTLGVERLTIAAIMRMILYILSTYTDRLQNCGCGSCVPFVIMPRAELWSNMIDIRSDTVTKPTEAMRKAMAEAEVGDDVFGDDPTVNRLEALGAEMLGKEAALFVPSGTFGNQLALFTWCPRGTEVILGEECHIVVHEAGAPAVIAGAQLRSAPAPDGVLRTEASRRRLRRQDLHAPATSLI